MADPPVPRTWEEACDLYHDLVFYVVRGHGVFSSTMNFDDNIQEAFIALKQAVEDYDPDRGKNFMSYAVNVIKWRLWRRFSHDCSSFKIPDGPAWECSLFLRTGELPKDRHVARAAQFYYRDKARLVVDGDMLVVDDTEVIEDRIQAAKIIDDHKFKHRHGEEVLRRRFVDGDHLETIGQDLGVTRERIRQIEARELAAIRRRLEVMGTAADKKIERHRRRS